MKLAARWSTRASAQYERVHRLAPDNATGLLLLTRGWAEAGWSFVEDDWEVSTDLGDDEAAEDHRTRARGAYTRAVFYGLELLEQKAQDFDHVRKSPGDLRKWLRNFDASDAETLAWTGWAWLGRAEMSRDIPALAQGADVGVALLERSIELDEKAHYGLAHLALGAWYARTASQPSLDKARKHFDRALQLNQRKYLPTQVLYARTLYCLENDEKAYVQLLEEVLDAGDPLPEARPCQRRGAAQGASLLDRRAHGRLRVLGINPDHAVSHGDHVGIVADAQQRSLPSQADERVDHALLRNRIEAHGRFVEQHDRHARGQGSC